MGFLINTRVGLDSATKAKFVERPRYSAEGGIGASRSRIQCALGGLHRATRPIGVDLDSKGLLRVESRGHHNIARPKPPRAPPSGISPCKPLGDVVARWARDSTFNSPQLFKSTPMGRVALCNPPKAHWIREREAPIPPSAL
jgi:hypothetical protein